MHSSTVILYDRSEFIFSQTELSLFLQMRPFSKRRRKKKSKRRRRKKLKREDHLV
jgi:hypothetical protein